MLCSALLSQNLTVKHGFASYIPNVIGILPKNRTIDMNILLVDDDGAYRKSLKHRLQARGHVVIEAADGMEALERLSQEAVHALVSDTLMPRMDGYQLCDEVRKSKRFARLPVVLYSAVFTTGEDEANAMKVGVDYFFRKPVPEDALLEALDDLQAREEKRRGSAAQVQGQAEPLKEYSHRLVERLERSAAELQFRTREFERSELRFQTLANTTAAAILIYSEERILYVNPAAETLTGYEAEQLLSKNLLDLVHPSDRAVVRERGLAKGVRSAPSRFEFKILTKPGGTRSLDFTASVMDHEGEGIIIGTAYDVTEGKQAEQELRFAKERLESFFDNTGDAIAIFDLEGTVLQVNKAFETIYGWSAEEVIGRRLPTVPMDLMTDAMRIIREIKSGGKIVAYDAIRLKKDGTRFEANVTISPVRDAAGNVVSMASISRDISEIKRAEEQRRVLEAQLMQAQKMETIGILAGGMAHDFNNILGIILGQASVIQRAGGDRAALAKCAEAITESVQRGAGLVQQILTFARKSDVSPRPTDVNAVVIEISKMLREAFPQTITISLQLAKNIPLVTLDQDQLYQALLNLCVNARDAMLDPMKTGQKGGTLSISTTLMDSHEVRERFHSCLPSRHVKVSVSDTGMGMDRKTKEKIFRPFFTTKGGGRGTGLGLAVVNGVVQRYKGFVDVESEPGKGTDFHLYFPASEAATTAVQGRKEERGEPPGGTETVLLVEDERSLLELLNTVLKSKGYNVVTAENGVEAIEKYMQQKEKISLVLTDMGLPKLDGASVLVTLREMNPSLRVILASGYLEPQLRLDLLNAGAKGFVQKPYEASAILHEIREVLDRTP